MRTITIRIDEAQDQALREKAARFGLHPEQLLATVIEALIQRPEADFDEAVCRVLEKNRDLYGRLA